MQTGCNFRVAEIKRKSAEIILINERKSYEKRMRIVRKVSYNRPIIVRTSFDFCPKNVCKNGECVRETAKMHFSCFYCFGECRIFTVFIV